MAKFCFLLLLLITNTFASTRLGFYAINTATGQLIQQNANQRFPLCSTAKLMVVADILKRSETHPKFLSQRIHFTDKTLKASGYAPITKQHLKTGMTIQSLCAAAISDSDNAAANLLIKQLGGPKAVTDFAHSIGNETFRLDRWEPYLNSAIPGDKRDTASPKSMAMSLEKLTLGNVLAIKQRQLLIQWLVANTTGNQRIRKAVPQNWLVGDKTGTGAYGTTNDIAVIWPPHRKPIVMAIYFTQSWPNANPAKALLSCAAQNILEGLNVLS